MIHPWRNLEIGEKLGVVALSSPVDPEDLDSGLEIVRSWGYEVVEASNLRSRSSYLAGSDAERLRGLDEVLNAGSRCIFMSRGGFGITRLLDRMPWSRLLEDRISFIGYSDATPLLNALIGRGVSAVQFHGPVISELGQKTEAAEGLHIMLERGGPGMELFRFDEGNIMRPGKASGPAMGGNLSLLAAVCGSRYQPDLSGSVLFLEEIKEPAYRIDRMLTQLQSAGMLENVSAVVCGTLKACRDEAKTCFRQRILELLPKDVPILDMMPFGHGKKHRVIPLGALVDLDCVACKLVWRN